MSSRRAPIAASTSVCCARLARLLDQLRPCGRRPADTTAVPGDVVFSESLQSSDASSTDDDADVKRLEQLGAAAMAAFGEDALSQIKKLTAAMQAENEEDLELEPTYGQPCRPLPSPPSTSPRP